PPPAYLTLASLILHAPPPPTSPLIPYTTLFRSFSYRHQKLGPNVPNNTVRRVHGKDRLFLRSFAAGRKVSFAFQYHPDGLIMQADRKSTRLNSSHVSISYAVFCLKKKKNRLHKY